MLALSMRQLTNIAAIAAILWGLNWALQWTTGTPLIACFFGGVVLALQPVVMPVMLVFACYFFFLWFSGGFMGIAQHLLHHLPFYILASVLFHYAENFRVYCI